MKRLLTIFSIFSMGGSLSLTTISCSMHEKNFDDNKIITLNQDLETINTILEQAKKRLQSWWETKTNIDMNSYPNEMSIFQEFLIKLQKNSELMLVGDEIYQWNFLKQLIIDFKKELNIINQEIIKQYANYYYDILPLSLNEKNIRLTLKLVNFDNLARMMASKKQTIKGITIKFNIPYEVSFKELQVPDSISSLVVASNNILVLSNIQQKMANYFVTFIDDLFGKYKYQIIEKLKRNFNNIDQSNTIWQIITEKLRSRKINFVANDHTLIFNTFYSIDAPTWNFKKEEDSVLAWAGEGYDPTKLTPENFLKFYEQKYIKNKVQIKNNYYVRANITSFIPNDFMIENLPFNNKTNAITLKTPIKVLTSKQYIDNQLFDFAKKIMNFWHYYKIETYSNKIVFNVTKADFTMLSEKISNFQPSASFFTNIGAIFRYLSDKHDLKLVLNSITSNGWMHLGNYQNSFVFNFFWRPDTHNCYPQLVLSFAYNSFSYGLFINPVPVNNKTGYVFLQTIEFKIV
ncbi:MAG: hypothetical protein EHV01_004795 [Spiroplasma sp. hy2]|uniref:hypothetical protein n=1 Tax=Spiroplasma sp. hy2 TaxID=2490850 RepID=UPI00383E4983